MQYCTACNKAIATIHILDLKDGSISEEKHLCASCADQTGMVQLQKVSPLKLGSAEMLGLIGNLKSTEIEGGKRRGAACPACGLSLAEFKVRGRMGCPRCYEVFRTALVPVLERVHDATCHRGRSPGRGANPPTPADLLADLRQKLAAAIQEENYEEAASIRDKIRSYEEAPGEAS
jgi:protein arginine kinase activator